MCFTQNKPDECPVCYESLDNEQTSLSCGHWCHKSCIIQSKKAICPLCRTSIALSDDDHNKIVELQIKEIINSQNTSIANSLLLSNLQRNSILDNNEIIDDGDYEDNDEYENEYAIPEDEIDEPFYMQTEQYIVTFLSNYFNNFEDEAICYDGRVASVIRTINAYVYKCAFTNEFEAINFCNELIYSYHVHNINLVDRFNSNNNIIQRGRFMNMLEVD